MPCQAGGQGADWIVANDFREASWAGPQPGAFDHRRRHRGLAEGSKDAIAAQLIERIAEELS